MKCCTHEYDLERLRAAADMPYLEMDNYIQISADDWDNLQQIVADTGDKT